MGIRITFFLLLLPLFSVAQTTDTKDVQWARQKLIIGTDAADYLNEITQTISAASTHVQSPTAKAVYDYLTGFFTTVNLSFSGTSSPVTLANSGGTDVTITAGTGVSLSATSSDITISNTQPLGTGTENYFPKWGTGGTVLTGTSNVFGIGKFLGVNNISPASIINPVVPADTHGIRINYSYFTGTSRRPLSVINQDALETFAIGGSRTANEGNIFLSAPSVQGSGSGITFTSNVGGTSRTGLFQLDNSGNLVFRHSTSGSSMYFDFMSSAIWRDNGFTTRFLVNSTEAACTNNFKLGTYSGSAATTITGRDASNFLTSVTIGSGLSLSGGTLSASAGSSWLLDGNTVGSLKTIGTNDNFDLPFETNGTIRGRFSTTGDFLINSTTTGNKLNVEGLGSSGVCARFNGGTFASGSTGVIIGGNATTTVTGLDVNMTVTGASNNLINRFRNGSTGASLHQIVVSSTSTADAMQQFQVEGGSGTTWIHGLDNSDADRYKIQPYSALGDGLLGIQIEKTGQVGISAAPAADLSLGFGLTKPLGLPSGVTADRAGSASIFSNTENGRIEDRATSSVYKTIHSITTPTLTPGSALGTGGTMAVTLVSGNEMAGRISIRTGATGLGTGTVMTFAYPTSMLGGAYPVWSAYGQNTPLQMNNFYISGIGSGSWTMAVLTTLSPNTTYEITYQIWQ